MTHRNAQHFWRVTLLIAGLALAIFLGTYPITNINKVWTIEFSIAWSLGIFSGLEMVLYAMCFTGTSKEVS